MISFTDRAQEMLRTFLGEDDEGQALRIRVGGPRTAPQFDLSLVHVSDRDDGETTLDGGDIPVLVQEDDVELVDGATIDFVERVNESGFEVQPVEGAIPSPKGRGNGKELEGPIADRVREVLDSQVNPAIAAHGGMIALVDVDETEIFVEMGGGCQGCALSRMTLRQGVERMLREAVPELTAVHDVTDHASGENPYL
ncbi:MAG: NifU family protein [Longimicrobiales bacterium]|nr:NifU family protein [Longimicrobiales bacterium]